MSKRILIVEDEPIIAVDIESTLMKGDYIISGIAYSSVQALDMLYSRDIDLVLLDISIKGDMDGIEIAAIINEKYHLPFIFITSFSDQLTLQRAKLTMPYGYIVKPFKDRDILSSIEIALYRYDMDSHQAELTLQKAESVAQMTITESEYKILNLLWEGKPNKMIADELFVSVNTIKTHIKNLFTKFDVSTRTELIARLR